LPFTYHKSILVSSNVTHPMVYLAAEFYYNQNQTYKYEILVFPLLNDSAVLDTHYYYRSANGTADN
jgi:hypothetical protein